MISNKNIEYIGVSPIKLETIKTLPFNLKLNGSVFYIKL